MPDNQAFRTTIFPCVMVPVLSEQISDFVSIYTDSGQYMVRTSDTPESFQT